MQPINGDLCEPANCGKIIAAKIKTTANTTRTSISVNPLMFLFPGSVFMIDSTVTPPAPATSPFFTQRRRRDIFVETQTKISPAPSRRHLPSAFPMMSLLNGA
jgi:hypothetical protein